MNARHKVLFLAFLIARFAEAEPPELPGPAPSPVWTPPQLTATPTPGAAPGSDVVAGRQAEPADKTPPEAPSATPVAPEPTPEKKIAGNPANQQDAQPAVSPVAADAPRSDLLSTLANRQDQPVRLTIDEAAGVEMTREWRERAKDFESQNMTDGAVQFTWPAEIPSIVCAVLQVTDIALEPGEAITSVSTGDNLRWSVEAVVSGEGASSQPHLIIKPFDRGLLTSLVVTTTRRSYHLTLRSTDQEYMHEVSFTYPGEPQKQASPPPQQAPKVNVALTQEVDPPATPEKKIARKTSGDLPRGKVSRDPPGHPEFTQDPDTYRISGNPRWRPINVYNDGRKTYVVMTEEMTKTEAPAMLVLRRNNYLFGYDKVLANYRVQHKTYIVDTVFDRAILVNGRDKVTLTRVPGKMHEINTLETTNAGTGK
jgi:type IV secretion system protein TrbG